jgi:DNA-binding transcriptional MerR regulator
MSNAMRDYAGFHTIGVVSRQTGIHPETLRVWEKRYQLVVPTRTDTGRRVYSDADLYRLSLVKQLVDQGYPPSGLANLTVEKLKERLAGKLTKMKDRNASKHAPVKALFIGSVFQSVLDDHPAPADEILLLGCHASFADYHGDGKEDKPDVLVVYYPTLHEDLLKNLKESLESSGAIGAVVVFNIASRTTVAYFEDNGVLCLKFPASFADIRRACASVADLPSFVSGETGDGRRQFTDEQLAYLAVAKNNIACECLNHLAEIVTRISAFEAYSAECSNRNPTDVKIHRLLQKSSQTARSIMEESLNYVIAAESIKLE